MLDLRADPAATTPRQETRIGSENAVLYPLFMDVSGSRCVVVGGGGVASRKVRGLLESGARVVVVSPEVVPEIEGMDVTVERRPYRPGDLAGAALPAAPPGRRGWTARVRAPPVRRACGARRRRSSGGPAAPATSRGPRWPSPRRTDGR